MPAAAPAGTVLPVQAVLNSAPVAVACETTKSTGAVAPTARPAVLR